MLKCLQKSWLRGCVPRRISCLLLTVDVVMVDVAQRDEVIDRVRSPIFVMPFVVKLQHLARIVGR